MLDFITIIISQLSMMTNIIVNEQSLCSLLLQNYALSKINIVNLGNNFF